MGAQYLWMLRRQVQLLLLHLLPMRHREVPLSGERVQLLQDMLAEHALPVLRAILHKEKGKIRIPA
jgi:hypothetical protein